MAEYYIYKHTNIINNKVYIGQTSLDPVEKRWGSNGIRYKGKTHFWSAIQKYGWDNFKHEIIEKVETKVEADNRERYWISFYNSNNNSFGYNMTSGGDGGRKLTEELIEANRKRMLTFFQTDKGKEVAKEQSKRMTENNPNKNKTGIQNHLAKPVFCEELKQFFGSAQEASRKTGTDASSIIKVCKGKQQRAGHKHWRYASDIEIIALKEGHHG